LKKDYTKRPLWAMFSKSNRDYLIEIAKYFQYLDYEFEFWSYLFYYVEVSEKGVPFKVENKDGEEGIRMITKEELMDIRNGYYNYQLYH
jgi:hypothetical protein